MHHMDRWGLGARRLATYTSHLQSFTGWIAKWESEGWHPTKNTHNWIPLPLFMSERTFMQKMFVKLRAWFGPEHAKTSCKHLRSWVIFSRMIEAVAFIATASKGIGCCCCRCFFFFCGKKTSFSASLQIAPWQGFYNIIQPNQYKEKQQVGHRRQKASHIHKSLT